MSYFYGGRLNVINDCIILLVGTYEISYLFDYISMLIL